MSKHLSMESRKETRPFAESKVFVSNADSAGTYVRNRFPSVIITTF